MGSSIFRTGHNCWTVTQSDDVAVRIDSSNYFQAFMRAALEARDSLFIVGWDFHSRAQLLGDGMTLPEEPGAPRLLGDFLNYLCERRRSLRIALDAEDAREIPDQHADAQPAAARATVVQEIPEQPRRPGVFGQRLAVARAIARANGNPSPRMNSESRASSAATMKARK